MRRDLTPICWWCGEKPATTAEHATKQSDLKSRYGRSRWLPAEAPVIVMRGGPTRRVQGPDSDLVKFSKTLCEACNSARSQPFDQAYEVFSEHLLTHRASLAKSRRLRFDRVYGDAFGPLIARLLGYFMKLTGCAMVERGLPVPRSFIDRIGRTSTAPFGVTMSINTDVRDHLDHRTFSPIEIGPYDDGTLSGVLLNGMFEIRVWWGLKPRTGQLGTFLSRPTSTILIRDVPWGFQPHASCMGLPSSKDIQPPT